tara:strand:- start:2158 stop:2613 length:456 start_codon:yes stop_codon:yes gene_type:complete
MMPVSVKKTLARSSTLLSVMLLGACSTLFDAQEIEAVRDYVVANELKEVDKIRLYRQLNYTYINDQYITVDARTGDFLIEFKRVCRDLSRTDFTPEMVDRRYDSSVLRAGFDTIRGCPIGKIYEVSKEQREELSDLGDAPGDEVYLPEDDD